MDSMQNSYFLCGASHVFTNQACLWVRTVPQGYAHFCRSKMYRFEFLGEWMLNPQEGGKLDAKIH